VHLARDELRRCADARFLICSGYFDEEKPMDTKKIMADSAKPVPEALLRKMIASGKSVHSKANDK
jgi:hypothetical protein